MYNNLVCHQAKGKYPCCEINLFRQPQEPEQKQRSTPGEKPQGHHFAVWVRFWLWDRKRTVQWWHHKGKLRYVWEDVGQLRLNAGKIPLFHGSVHYVTCSCWQGGLEGGSGQPECQRGWKSGWQILQQSQKLLRQHLLRPENQVREGVPLPRTFEVLNGTEHYFIRCRRTTWAEEKKLNLETFGVSGRFLRGRGFRGRGRGDQDPVTSS